jgi:hypothetical protein
MRLRALVSSAVGAALLLLLVLWLLWPADSNAGDAARLTPRESAAAPPPAFALAPAFAPPIEGGEPQPVVALDASPAPAAPRLELPPASPRVAAERPMTIDVGVVMPDGEALAPLLPTDLARLSVVATAEPPGERLPESAAPFYSRMGLGSFDAPAYGNANPTPRVAGFIGTLTLPREMSVQVSLALGPIVIATQPAGPHDQTVLFVVAAMSVEQLAGELRLIVADALTHEAIAGAAVEVGVGANLSRRGRPALSDDLGAVHVRQLRAGPTQVWVSAPGFEQRGFDATIPSASTLDLGLVELLPATTIMGRVLHTTGEPAANAYVMAFLDDAALRSSFLAEPFTSVKADEGGSFAIEGLGPRRYALVVLARAEGETESGSRMALALVDATRGPVTDLVLTVAAAARVSVRNPAGREGVSVHVRNEIVPSFDWWPDIPYLRSPDERTISLVPGRYALELTVPGQPTSTRQLEVFTNPVTVDLGQ